MHDYYLHFNIIDIKAQIQDARKKEQQRFAVLSQFGDKGKDTQTLIQWIREKRSRDEFKGTVFEPILFQVSIQSRL